jgi:hypothetical protein
MHFAGINAWGSPAQKEKNTIWLKIWGFCLAKSVASKLFQKLLFSEV